MRAGRPAKNKDDLKVRVYSLIAPVLISMDKNNPEKLAVLKLLLALSRVASKEAKDFKTVRLNDTQISKVGDFNSIFNLVTRDSGQLNPAFSNNIGQVAGYIAEYISKMIEKYSATIKEIEAIDAFLTPKQRAVISEIEPKFFQKLEGRGEPVGQEDASTASSRRGSFASVETQTTVVSTGEKSPDSHGKPVGRFFADASSAARARGAGGMGL